jgi:type IX secretion system PorP/SprF family membrane protein
MSFRYKTVISAFLLLTGMIARGQDTWYGSVSGMQFMYNPAYTGATGGPAMNISAYTFLPGNGFGLRSVYASYDSYVTSLHGGAGVWISDDMLGEILNDFRTGACYSYHLRAGRNLWFKAGLTASLIWRGIKTGAVVLPGDIDPFGGITGGSSEYYGSAGAVLFDLGTGLTVETGPWYGGLSVMHLTQPSPGDDNQERDRVRRLYTLTAGATFNPGDGDFALNPSALVMAQGNNVTAFLGTEAEYRNLLFGISLWHSFSGFTALQPSAGWGADAIRIILSYSYIIAGGSSAFGGTAIVRAGLSLSFNNVEKSRVPHIIKLPVL